MAYFTPSLKEIFVGTIYAVQTHFHPSVQEELFQFNIFSLTWQLWILATAIY